MSLLTLLRAAIAGSTSDGPILDIGNRIENGEPFIAVQIGQKSGIPLVLPYRGKCSNLATDDVFASLQVGGLSAERLAVVTVSQCDGSVLPASVPLVGVQIGQRSGVPLILVTCEQCGEPEPCDDCSPCPGATVYPNELTVTVDVSCMSAPATFTLNADFIGSIYCGDVGADPQLSNPGDLRLVAKWSGVMNAYGDDSMWYSGERCDGTGAAISLGEYRLVSAELRIFQYVSQDRCIKLTYAVAASFRENLSGDPSRFVQVGGYNGFPFLGTGNICDPNLVVNACSPLDISASGSVVCQTPTIDCMFGTTPFTSCVGASWTIEVTA